MAVGTFVSTFQQALSCLTLARFNAEGYRPIDLPYRAALRDGEPVALAGSSLQLLVVIRYQTVRAAAMRNSWTVQLAAYDDEIVDANGREIVAYQWHPQSRSPVTWPHFHLGPV